MLAHKLVELLEGSAAAALRAILAQPVVLEWRPKPALALASEPEPEPEPEPVPVPVLVLEPEPVTARQDASRSPVPLVLWLYSTDFRLVGVPCTVLRAPQ